MKVSDLNPTFYAASINPLMHYLYMWPVQFFRKGEPCESLGEQLQGRLAGLLLQLPQDEGEWETASAWSSHGCCNITSCSLAKSDFNRSGVSFSCWYGGPSDSDNWGNGLKLKSEILKRDFLEQKLKTEPFWMSSSNQWTWGSRRHCEKFAVQIHDGGGLLWLLLGGEARWVQCYLSGDFISFQQYRG